jgi:hemerythrin superfamily protein
VRDLLTQLEAEHKEVSDLLEQLEQSEEPAERMQLLGTIETALNRHMEVEERQVYPLVRELDGEMAQEAQNEHDGARELLAKVREMAPDVPGFGGAVAALKGAIEHHVEDEEGEAFPKLRSKMKGRIPAADRPADDSAIADMTREELYEKAQELDIPGRSGMSKDDLQRAVETASRR